MSSGVCTRPNSSLHRDGHHQDREQRAQLLAAHLRADAHAHLHADDAAGDQQERQHDVDRLVGRGVKDRRGRRHEQDLELRRADDDVGRHPQEIDHRRDRG